MPYGHVRKDSDVLPKKAMTAALSVALCGTLAVVPVAFAAPKEPAPPVQTPLGTNPQLPPLPSLTTPPAATPNATPSPWGWPFPAAATPNATPSPTPTGPSLTMDEDPQRQRERLAKHFKLMGKAGRATGGSSDLAGSIIGGERDPKKIDEAVSDANKELDNLMAFAPGGSPNSSLADRAQAAGRDARGTIELLKKDHLQLGEQAKKNDVAGWMTTMAFMIMHLGFLTMDIFFALGMNVAQAFLPFKLPEFKMPDFSPQATQPPPTGQPNARPSTEPNTAPTPQPSPQPQP
ncbi:hypothetical protein P8605_15290 [Streptomyces sp. T-3]|nr:hypothetical protein [Streptomyces sp. T-3]